MQAPLQFTSVPGHETEHVPELQTWPLAQVVPALPPVTPHPVVAPQWVGSVLGVTQAPLQFTSVPGQETEHVPELQTWPLTHVLPALPPVTPHPVVAPQ